jgi:uncharacterized protein DUF87
VPDGLLTASDARGTWVWSGVVLDAAADLTETREYAELPERERYTKAVAAETAWLAGQWDTAGAGRFELRYLTEPDAGRLRAALLGRVWAPVREDAVGAARALRSRLADLPRHVHAAPMADDNALARWLDPFVPHPAGIVEIRKRVRAARPNRPDAGVRYYLAVQPFSAAAPSWEPVWRAMIAHPAPVMLSVALAPFVVSRQVNDMLAELATRYGRLGTPGQMPDGIWSPAVPLAADAFAVDAARLFADAARRYSSRTFRVRVTVASPEPLGESLPELIASTISPPEQASDAAVLTATFQGAAHIAVRPEPDELAAARTGLSRLELNAWDAQYVRGLPEVPPAGLRLLAELVDPREAGAALRLPLAVQGHMPGFPVRRPGMALEADYRPSGPTVGLGRQLVADREAGPMGIGVSALTRHALFVGTTGSGKTNSTLAFCEQLWRDRGVPFLVIEPVNSTLDDYRWLATRPGFEDMLVLTVGNEAVAPFRLNPFEVPPGVRVGSHIAGLLACFDAAFGLWDPLPAIYNRALRAAYSRRGIIQDTRSDGAPPGGWPTLGDFVAEMRRQTEALDYAGEVRSNIIAASRLRAETLAEGACATTLDCVRSYPISELLRRPVVLELAGVGDNEKEQTLLTALVLQTMTEFYKAGREGDGLAHVTVIEEAHRLLGKPIVGGDVKEGNAQARAAQAFANTLAENRKYGEGLVIVEQVPGKLVEDAYKNTNLKLMHRLPAEDDRRLIGATMRFSPDQERYASTLEPFTAFAYHDALDRPALVRLPNVRADAARTAGLDRAPLADDAHLATTFRRVAQEVPELDAAIAPYAECEGCRSRCLFRTRAAASAWPERAAELKQRVQAYPAGAQARSDWWRDTMTQVRSVGAAAAPADPTPQQRLDYDSCVLIHMCRQFWRRDILPWVRLFRERAEDQGARQ